MQGDNGGATSDPRLKAWFDSVDLNKSNSIDVKELHRALGLAGLEFGMNTCALLIRMHDTDRNGTINFEEFQRMHNFIMSVRASFVQFDRDRNGFLDRDELIQALQLNRVYLDRQAFDAVFESFDIYKRNNLSLSDYIAMAAFLTCSRNMFSRFDPYKTGTATFNFSTFCFAMSYLR
uniref:EF-hand domain-containing protein n=1 Tax=Rhodosorus marinus TaxID=101924 RepID=A0A7S0BMC1_9RHOD|mmetsp:Transcript_21881/g.31720  ORF Transcript_21881/g.31720 Transcript_21881/m.31720 type:complete len:177 (+) Transcript_21881:107-637(+)